MQNFVKKGHSITIVADQAYESGDAVVIGDRAGIAAHDAAQGANLEVVLEGVVHYAKAAIAVSPGEKLYYASGADNVNKTSSGNKPIGWSAEDASSPSTVTSIDIKLGAW